MMTTKRKEQRRVATRKYRNTAHGRSRVLLKDARHRARKKRLKCTITVDWLESRISEGVCEVSGLPLVISAKKSPWTPSLDRINPRKGYTPENTRVVVWLYNMAKGDHSDDDVSQLMEALFTRRKRSKRFISMTSASS